MKRLLIYIMTFMLMVVINSCSDKSDNIPSFSDYPTMDRLIEGGYEDLLNGDYEDANQKFRQANERDAFDIRVYDGLGWSYLLISSPDLAISAFSNLETFGEEIQADANANAGMAISYCAKKEYESAKGHARKCFNLQSNYVHEILDFINVNDLHVILAECYWDQNKLDSMLVELQHNNANALADELIDVTNQVYTIEQDSMITPSQGIVRIPMNGENVALVEHASFESGDGYVKVDHLNFADNEVVLFSNPIPRVGTAYQLTYKKVNDYTDFQAELDAELQQQISEYQQ